MKPTYGLTSPRPNGEHIIYIVNDDGSQGRAVGTVLEIATYPTMPADQPTFFWCRWDTIRYSASKKLFATPLDALAHFQAHRNRNLRSDFHSRR